MLDQAGLHLAGRHPMRLASSTGTCSSICIAICSSGPTTAAGIGDTEGALACLHCDAVVLLLRVELTAGQADQEAAAGRRQLGLTQSVGKRDAQSAIFGKRTMTEQRQDAAKVAKVSV